MRLKYCIYSIQNRIYRIQYRMRLKYCIYSIQNRIYRIQYRKRQKFRIYRIQYRKRLKYRIYRIQSLCRPSAFPSCPAEVLLVRAVLRPPSL
jgi:hypothetical protein